MLNKIILMGRLTRDPELRHTQTGTAVASFSLAVDRDFKDKATGDRTTDFIDVVAWRQTGEFVSRYFTKGRMAVVEGRLQIRDWTDKDGNKRRSAEVVADNVYSVTPADADPRPVQRRLIPPLPAGVLPPLLLRAPTWATSLPSFLMTTGSCPSERDTRDTLTDMV
mgnify:CR=1 FL=1